ncbi:MAG TPA: response regulator [Polyangia bacterium]|nr:response regulator [Polyangia bacterium]
MIAHFERSHRAGRNGDPFSGKAHWSPRQRGAKGRVLVVEDDELLRDAMGPLLEAEGYDVSFAENGGEALKYLHSEAAPDLIVLDLRMPVMNGWEFRAIQKDDPKLGLIPVVAISADGSAQAAAISAEAYLRKPVEPKEFLATIARVLLETKRRMLARVDETERLAALGRLAASVGHEINNPLAFVMMNLTQSIHDLQPWKRPAGATAGAPLGDVELGQVNARMADVSGMLEDCRVGSERIRETVSNLQRLSCRSDDHREAIDVHTLIDQSVSMVWNQIRHRARLVKTFGKIPPIAGNKTTLGQVFLNLVLNAAQAMPEGDAEWNEIRISSTVQPGEEGDEVVVEISDSGKGIPAEILTRVFEPFFTTKPIGQGTGLGLSISRQVVMDHGGRMTVDSVLGKGTVFRVFLPIGAAPAATNNAAALPSQPALPRRRILVIDDEPLIGRVIRAALKGEHDVSVVQSARDALALLERGQTFDLVLCDVVMPDLSGPEFFELVVQRWPELVARMVFMTGGAFTPRTVDFMASVPTRVLSKPFTIDRLKGLVRELAVGAPDELVSSVPAPPS